jgi:hypothetical protein
MALLKQHLDFRVKDREELLELVKEEIDDLREAVFLLRNNELWSFDTEESANASLRLWCCITSLVRKIGKLLKVSGILVSELECRRIIANSLSYDDALCAQEIVELIPIHFYASLTEEIRQHVLEVIETDLRSYHGYKHYT